MKKDRALIEVVREQPAGVQWWQPFDEKQLYITAKMISRYVTIVDVE